MRIEENLTIYILQLVSTCETYAEIQYYRNFSSVGPVVRPTAACVFRQWERRPGAAPPGIKAFIFRKRTKLRKPELFLVWNLG